MAFLNAADNSRFRPGGSLRFYFDTDMDAIKPIGADWLKSQSF